MSSTTPRFSVGLDRQNRIRVRREIVKSPAGSGPIPGALGDLAVVHRTYVALVERGDATPTLYSVVRFAEALCVDPAGLVRGLKTGLPKRRRR